ncbi:serine/threonine-protein kinase [Kribbella sp. NPDC050470]|uniref:serine/threonine-protein kinase n=1 Tax=unclassified Kribbella TaxID=2644121 RepID=UPI0037AEEE21
MLVAKRYRLGPSIGRGGMGEVFRATDEQLGRPVAVKLLLPTDRDPRSAERFHREARAAARLNDPHVVSVYDFGNHDDGFFLVMELVEGGTVGDELTEHGPLAKDRAIDLIEQAAAGLAAAHREDVVHRDVKPGNLLLTADGIVKVADFGIAHLPGEGTTTLTEVGAIIGSTLYLAPERAMGRQAGMAADVYALGCVLYQLVTGQPPFTAEHPTAILYQHVDATPEPPSRTRPELAGPFEALLLRMLAKDPAVRPTAAEIAGGALRAEPVAVTQPLTPLSQRKTLLAGAIAVLATTAAVMAAVLMNGDEPSTPPTTDVGPQPSVTSNPPTTAPTGTSSETTTERTEPGTTTRTTPTTSPSPSQTPSQQPSPTPSPTPTPSASPTPTRTTTTSPTPTEEPSSTAPSSTPPPESPSGTPATSSPSPGAQGND